ncbi:glycosyltransferase family 47 protein [Sabulilitoribacter arenilitoris]|uniref:Glycosyltransferase family 47 protein n=1 Tax=Wocania arenilitoris TaxID=2044858 RepID=A0AAE3JM59_9FLAO|nr:exostosin family protein [Wocania arenilitoris]MCF7568972.1 glycosyltransferase family 47 protein [Wocania arenilitoris]
MLKLYTNTGFLTEENRKRVFPLLFDLYFVKSDVLQRFYKIVTNIKEADIVVFPINYVSFLKHKKELLKLQKLAKTYKKPIWIYSAGDYGFTNYIENSYTFRFGGFKSKLNDSTYIMSSFIDDPYDSKLPQSFSVLQKENKPSIGFVGHAQSGILKYLKELLSHIKVEIKRKLNLLIADAQSFYPSSIKRVQFLTQLKLTEAFNTNFVLRNRYRAGAKTEAENEKTTKEFYNNIFNNAYTFCIRGGGNFSVRFYETLAVGRIPILLNTDCLLPLNDKIEWCKHCVIIDEADAKLMTSKIIDFHNNLSDDEFVELQKSNRDLWNNYLRRHTFFKEVHDDFVNENNSK